MTTTEKTPETWLVDECRRGIALLMALALPWRPSPDDAGSTAKAWAYAIANRTSLSDADAPRVRAAFARLAGTAQQWPAPADLIAALPARTKPAKATLQLTQRDRAHEQAFMDVVTKVLGAPLGSLRDSGPAPRVRDEPRVDLAAVEAELRLHYGRRQSP